MLVALLLLALFQPSANGRAEAERLFALGQQLFEEGDVAGAAAAFEGAVATGWTSGALHFNLGTAYLRLGRTGLAVLHLERARRFRPDDEAVTHNLRLAYERAAVTPLAEASPPVVAVLQRTVGVGGLMGLALVLYLGTLALVGYRLWTRTPTAALRRALVVLAPLTGVALVLAVWTWNAARTPTGIVLNQTVLRAAPGSDAPERRPLAAGQPVRLLGAEGAWRAAQLPDGTRGWLPVRAVEEL